MSSQPGRSVSTEKARPGLRHRSVWRIAPIVAMCLTGAFLAFQCLVLMHSIGTGPARVGIGLQLALVAFVASVLLVLLVEIGSIGRRFERPEQHVRSALQRIRAGDIGFRVSLRRGEPLAGLARECNEVLDWLNANPPQGVRVGGDIVDVPVDDAEGQS